MAEYLLKSALRKAGLWKNFEVSSAGIAASDGSPASAFAVAAMENINGDIARHVSRTITQKILNSADVIFCMAAEHREFLLANFESIREKCFLVKKFLDKKNGDIEDPFFGGAKDYERVRDDINSAMDSILKFLANGNET
jgi:protein-tyrosine-phosphatase